MHSDDLYSPTQTWGQFVDSQTRDVLTMQGRLLMLKHQEPNRFPPKGGTRKPITGFSQAQRLALLKKLAIWDWDKINHSLFVTLTYPDDKANPCQAERNTHRYLFHRHLERYYQRKIPCLWRVEYLPRKSGAKIGEICPHWHLLLLGERFIPYQQINDDWKKTIGEEGYTRTEVKGARKSEAVGMYIAKYLSKEAVSLSVLYAANHNTVGRHYGVLRERQIPVCDKVVIPRLTPPQAVFLRQFAGESLPTLYSDSDDSFTMLGVKALDLISCFVGNYLDTGQEIAENDQVKGESPGKTVTGHAAEIRTPSGTFSPARHPSP